MTINQNRGENMGVYISFALFVFDGLMIGTMFGLSSGLTAVWEMDERRLGRYRIALCRRT